MFHLVGIQLVVRSFSTYLGECGRIICLGNLYFQNPPSQPSVVKRPKNNELEDHM